MFSVHDCSNLLSIEARRRSIDEKCTQTSDAHPMWVWCLRTRLPAKGVGKARD